MIQKFRDPVSGLTHLGAAVAALVGLIALLIAGREGIVKTASLAVYGVSLVLLFAASATYHLVKGSPGLVLRLRKLDHAAIYLLIAGTYTAFCLNLMEGFWKWGMLAIIWSLAVIGIVVKMWFIHAPNWASAGVYLAMGWLGIIGIKQILATFPPPALGWLAAGGIIYSLGAVVYVTKIFNFKPGVFGFHEVWHIFVILGALAHFIGVFFYVALA